ncbi:MAG: beta-N-acetylhexosaminidase [Myxococcota bacterium]|nr:beta-N-acetylhexosaminidase [Myxococcota bacterium]
MQAKATGEQTSLAWRKRRAGQRLILGFEGTTIPAGLRSLIRQGPPAGFILFARNIEEPAQARELNRELASLLPDSLPPLRSVDQEGGRVQRLSGTAWPSMRWLGNADDLVLTRQVAFAMSRELAACHFDLNWAPVADVSEDSGVIGDRSFSADPDRAAAHTAAFIEGARAAGIACVAKHFPGHGMASGDSHSELPVVELDRPELERRDLAPFRAAIAASVGGIMSAHVRFPAWDEELPATLSARVLDGVLRGDLGYSGVIFSDSMEMAALDDWPLHRRLSLACSAGLDVFLTGHSLDLQWEMFERLVHLQEGSALQDDRAIRSYKRVMALREAALLRRPEKPDVSIVGDRSHRDLAVLARARGMG